MSGAGQKFVLWSKRGKNPREGSVLDIDTGVLRRDHVLILRSRQAEITLGLGSRAAALMDFANGGETHDDPLLEACEKADRAISLGDLRKSRALGVPDVITTIENRARRRLALVECFVGKASPDDPVHPGYPAGAPDGKGGQFMPKDQSSETVQQLKRLKALREFRAAVQTALVLLRTALTDEIPGIDIAANIKAVIDLGQIAIQLGNDEDEINKAIKFVENGPYSLDELQVSGNGDSFSSFDDFKKISLMEALLRAYGAAGPGREWHHMVEQGGDNARNFSQEQLQSTQNIIPLPGPIHDLVTARYAEEYDTSGKTVRQWLSGQSFEDQ